MTFIENYRCPSCGALITRKNERELKCVQCHSNWEIRHKIPLFSKTNFYWGDIPEDKMKEMNDYAIKYGWRKALSKFFPEGSYNRKIHVEKENQRADFRYLLPLTDKSRILDVGCGMGSISLALSDMAKEVYSFDAVYERARFLSIRAHQEKKRNISVSVANLFEPPFPDNFFDIVILNGVLEWVGTLKKRGNPLEIQIDAINKLRDKLKDGGCLYLAIENRYGVSYILGQRDPHSGLRFSSILPRKVANLYCKLMKGESYRVYTHSYLALYKILKIAGFCDIHFFYPAPHYHLPLYLLPLDDKNVWDYFLDNISFRNSLKREIGYWGAKIINALNIRSVSVIAFGIVARKSQ